MDLPTALWTLVTEKGHSESLWVKEVFDIVFRFRLEHSLGLLRSRWIHIYILGLRCYRPISDYLLRTSCTLCDDVLL